MTDQSSQFAVHKADMPEMLSGGFISQPSDFADAPAELRHLVKYWYQPTFRDGKFGLEYATTAFLVDFSNLDARHIDLKKVAVDCDLLKKLAVESPKQVKQILTELQKGTSEGVEKATEIAESIGATEADFVKAGGGIVWLILAAILLAGCGGALKEKASSGTTTPKPKPPKDNPQ